MLSPLLRGAAPWQANSRLLLSPRSKRLLELLALEDGHLFLWLCAIVGGIASQ